MGQLLRSVRNAFTSSSSRDAAGKTHACARRGYRGNYPGLVSETWRGRPAAQQPAWPDADALAQAVDELQRSPGLVVPDECDTLRDRLASVAAGGGLLLPGGGRAPTPPGVGAGAGRGQTPPPPPMGGG